VRSRLEPSDVRRRLSVHLKFTEHSRLAMHDDDLEVDDVIYAINQDEIIERYPNSKPFRSCLLYGRTREACPHSSRASVSRRRVDYCHCISSKPRRLERIQEAKEKVRLDVCPICGGRTNEKAVDLLENLDGAMVVIKGIHAEVCVQCGEKLYAETELRKIEDARRRIMKKEIAPVRLEEVPVFQV